MKIFIAIAIILVLFYKGICNNGTLPEKYILVKISNQMLYLIVSNEVIKEYPISTSKYGIGNKKESNKTLLGKHRIVKKVGDGEPIGTVFKALRKTGEITQVFYDETDY